MARAVPAVERAFDVLELFLDTPELSAPEITAQLGLPRTTVHELVGTLADRGYLMPAGRGSNRYRLGVRGFQLGSAYAERLDLTREGQLVAEDVAERCQETVHVGVRDGVDVLYVVKVDSSHPVRMVSAVGRRLPAHCTALGKALLASLSRSELDELYGNRRLEAMTERSITTRKALRKELDAVAKDGVAGEYCESNEAVACVAAPVYDRADQVVAAMSISVPILRWNDETEAALRDLVREGAGTLSERLGYIGSRA
ncbi:transcriptional regulator [Saccharopolyspora subtropica]|uniref:Transcriptional regulator n=1 Tax=Saccharopolyspora thermophila TaxID=89367 RepID=A0A917JZ77_9PSEU|nr:IclR family transcriptional regulator [Saccharopolyspora subtropica]GGI91312.1 transcriptional regulator [Saccharopolyspora subtropica]